MIKTLIEIFWKIFSELIIIVATIMGLLYVVENYIASL